MTAFHEIAGGCHCGNITYKFFSPLPKSELPLRSCDCSFCTKQGACYTSHPKGRLLIQIKDQAQIKHYRFGTETAEAILCASCGCFPFITAELDGQTFAVLNANSIDDLQIDHAVIPPALHLVDFSVAERIRRWKNFWIGQVEIETFL
ncbi:GFA family protein [Geopsychrobacter electrodiphilus]|uniref:GFA family protein n=1 Tax=Geopsychrobacter electrodiphilus TaxID=225196 RepID=UPI00036E368D|nr:hypothetical protein [Geopsychrobacter electrodiphilus]